MLGLEHNAVRSASLRLKASPLALAGTTCVLLLAGCVSDGTLITSHNIDPGYDDQQVGLAIRDGQQMPIVITGNPFAGDRAAVDRAVVGAMNCSNFGPAFSFAVDPAQPATQNAHVALVFNPAKSVLPDNLCRTVPQSGALQGTQIRVDAAYCEGGRAMTSASGSASDIGSPDAAPFRTLMTQLAAALFPPANPHRDHGDVCINC
jgi:hypothetical protein